MHNCTLGVNIYVNKLYSPLLMWSIQSCPSASFSADCWSWCSLLFPWCNFLWLSSLLNWLKSNPKPSSCHHHVWLSGLGFLRLTFMGILRYFTLYTISLNSHFWFPAIFSVWKILYFLLLLCTAPTDAFGFSSWLTANQLQRATVFHLLMATAVSN